ncbi:hypothetical protein J6590_015446 [Homalodisca vitripennis]|nr:hypothetical protein J6590_015446 [Homalodisca vitripennis]
METNPASYKTTCHSGGRLPGLGVNCRKLSSTPDDDLRPLTPVSRSVVGRGGRGRPCRPTTFIHHNFMNERIQARRADLIASGGGWRPINH